MDKVDFRSDGLYRPTGSIALVDVPGFPFLMVDGHGDPNTTPAYTDAVEALYSLSYTVKFVSKAKGRDYVVAPLEGLWSAERMAAFVDRSKHEWSWTMMIRQPDWLDDDDWDAARHRVSPKKLPALDAVRLESFAEGRAAQVMHTGPYDDEGPVIARLHEWIAANGLVATGRHHEVYLGDPRRAAPGKLRTILRQPVTSRSAPAVATAMTATARIPT